MTDAINSPHDFVCSLDVRGNGRRGCSPIRRGQEADTARRYTTVHGLASADGMVLQRLSRQRDEQEHMCIWADGREI